MTKAAKATTGVDTVKNPVGRPFLFKTPKALGDAIDEYFDHCDNRVKTIYIKEAGDNVPISDPAPYTMAGLAYALGVDRKTLINYEGRDNYSTLVKRARQRVESNLEERMVDKNTFTAGIIFNLKNNFAWVDKTEVDQNLNGDVTFVNTVPRPKRVDDSGQSS